MVLTMVTSPTQSAALAPRLDVGRVSTTFSEEELAALKKAACKLGVWKKGDPKAQFDSPNGWLMSFTYAGPGAVPPRGWSEERLQGIVSVPAPPGALATATPDAVELRLPFGEAFAYARVSLGPIPKGMQVRSDGGLVTGHRESGPMDKEFFNPVWLLAQEIQSRESPYPLDKWSQHSCGTGSGIGMWLGRPAYSQKTHGLYYHYKGLRIVVKIGKQYQLLSAEIYGTTAPFAQHMYTLWHVMHGVQVRDGLRPKTNFLERSLGYGYPSPLPAPYATLTGLSPKPPFKKPKPRS
jgi:hypothetical protein